MSFCGWACALVQEKRYVGHWSHRNEGRVGQSRRADRQTWASQVGVVLGDHWRAALSPGDVHQAAPLSHAWARTEAAVLSKTALTS